MRIREIAFLNDSRFICVCVYERYSLTRSHFKRPFLTIKSHTSGDIPRVLELVRVYIYMMIYYCIVHVVCSVSNIATARSSHRRAHTI